MLYQKIHAFFVFGKTVIGFIKIAKYAIKTILLHYESCIML